MRSGAIPFRLNISGPLEALGPTLDGRHSSVVLSLPFINIRAHPGPRERHLAQELVVRLRDRRVLSSQECCDNCIDDALGSLQEIRSALVEVQVELIDETDRGLYGLIELMLVAIRQFLTFEQSLSGIEQNVMQSDDFRRPYETRQSYFDALELLRGHLSRCLGQVAVIAGLPIPSDGLFAEYRGPWDLNAYEAPGEPSDEAPASEADNSADDLATRALYRPRVRR